MPPTSPTSFWSTATPTTTRTDPTRTTIPTRIPTCCCTGRSPISTTSWPTRCRSHSAWIPERRRSAVTEDQQMIERAQLAGQAVQQVIVVHLDHPRHKGERMERAVDETAESRLAAHTSGRHAVAAIDDGGERGGLAGHLPRRLRGAPVGRAVVEG